MIKKRNSLSCLFLFLLLTVCGTTFSQTTLNLSFTSDGVLREYKLYIPAIYDGTTPVPLLFNIHGYTSTSTEQEFYGDFRPIADTANFIIVHPQGLDIGGGFGWDVFSGLANAIPDLNFISNIMDTVSASYNIDLNRVYSTGMSNGGFMSYELACFLGDRITAIASVTGGMTNFHRINCTATHPTPVMQIHGTADATVPYTGGPLLNNFAHVDTLVSHWVNFNNCSTTAAFTNLPDADPTDFSTVEHYVYDGGDMGTSVELYKIIGGGHTWPGTGFDIPGLVTNQDFSASAEIWRFFSQYSLEDLVVVGRNASLVQTELRISPNPSSTQFSFQFEKAIRGELRVYDMKGTAVFSKEIISTETAVDLTSSANGVYFYQLMTDTGEVFAGKLIKR